MNRTLYALEYYADCMLGNWIAVGIYSTEEKAREAHRQAREAQFRIEWEWKKEGPPEAARAAFEATLWDDVRLRPMCLDTEVEALS